MSDSLWPHESQHARPPCPSPNPRVHSDSRPSSRWCHPAISSSVIPFFSCPQSLPTSKSFPMSQLFAWGGQSTGFSFSIIPSKEIPGLISFRMDWLDLLAVPGTLKSLIVIGQYSSPCDRILYDLHPIQLSSFNFYYPNPLDHTASTTSQFLKFVTFMSPSPSFFCLASASEILTSQKLASWDLHHLLRFHLKTASH